MEAMSIERLLLAAWEEEGFIGRNRVPIDSSDVDVLVVNARERRIRIGEVKVRMTSQHVFPVDQAQLAEMERTSSGFEWWLEDDWARWLQSLPKLWSNEGEPCAPWLLPISEVRTLDVIFCCNLHIMGEGGSDASRANELLRKSVSQQLAKNSAVARHLGRIDVRAELMSTVEVAFSLARSVRRGIAAGYGRRFGDPFKDMFRELHRYLNPHFASIPRDAAGERLATRKDRFESEVRKQTALGLLEALGVAEGEVRSWFEKGAVEASEE